MLRIVLVLLALLLLPAPAYAQWEWSVPRAPGGSGLTVGNVGCTKQRTCSLVAADARGTYVLSTADLAATSRWKRVETLGPPGIATDIDCTRGDTPFCAVAGGNGPLTLWLSNAWDPLSVPIERRAADRVRVACASDRLCAVGADGLAVWTPDAWTVIDPDPVTALACASSGVCAAADATGEVLISTRPSSPASWRRYRVERPFTILACTFVGCVGADGTHTYGIIQFEPSTWITRTAPPGLATIGCAPRAFCVATTTDGAILLSRGLGNYEPSRTPSGPFHDATCVVSSHLCVATTPTAVMVGSRAPQLVVDYDYDRHRRGRRAIEVRLYNAVPGSRVTIDGRRYRADEDGDVILSGYKLVRPGTRVRATARATGLAGIEHRLTDTLTA
ncbi:hypothetical protein OJ997_16060 [Solirubrobacter phytolaccae]|uniref:Ig-like domain-containing protein n=1 Tax=Solirubrobacter phytolaccae TaxID=1404360 RepID=A0A9X3S8S1_9ACTN|nr:hypothetical protein [Solirubrobacter phytolaccae]MDA0181818.1 hypothetical protein [Solirubrobacter phytolaccae]